MSMVTVYKCGRTNLNDSDISGQLYCCTVCDHLITVSYTVPFDVWHVLGFSFKAICLICFVDKLDKVTEDFEIKIHKD